MRFPGFTDEWSDSYLRLDCEVNPKSPILEDEFVYIDLESVEKGVLIKRQIIKKVDAPSRAQRVLSDSDVLFQCVRPYQQNNYFYEVDNSGLQWVASTGYAQLRVKHSNPEFIYHLLSSPSFTRKVIVRCTGSNYPAINSEDLSNIHYQICSLPEQKKIAKLITLLNERIAAQNKIIEDLKSVISSISNKLFDGKMHIGDSNDEWVYMTLGDITTNFNRRNKVCQHLPMFSVTNISGFSPQNEVFEGKEIKDEDISIYKIIHKGEFAYNPARINVGSIGRYEGDAPCMISSLYICFRPKDNIDSDWLQYLLKSNKMVYQYGLYGEGGVRIYLFYPNFSRIKVWVPPLRTQEKIASILNSFKDKLFLETSLLRRLQEQKRYLLTRMFI